MQVNEFIPYLLLIYALTIYHFRIEVNQIVPSFYQILLSTCSKSDLSLNSYLPLIIPINYLPLWYL